jgi:hypothetical protein
MQNWTLSLEEGAKIEEERTKRAEDEGKGDKARKRGKAGLTRRSMPVRGGRTPRKTKPC